MKNVIWLILRLGMSVYSIHSTGKHRGNGHSRSVLRTVETLSASTAWRCELVHNSFLPLVAIRTWYMNTFYSPIRQTPTEKYRYIQRNTILDIIKNIVIELAQQITNSFMQWNKRLCYCRGTARRACQQKFCNYKISHLKTRVPGLSCGIICVILRLAVFTQYQSVTDTHADRRTDRYTTTACTALAQRRAVKIDHIALNTKYYYQATSVG